MHKKIVVYILFPFLHSLLTPSADIVQSCATSFKRFGVQGLVECLGLRSCPFDTSSRATDVEFLKIVCILSILEGPPVYPYIPRGHPWRENTILLKKPKHQTPKLHLTRKGRARTSSNAFVRQLCQHCGARTTEESRLTKST